MIIDQQDLLENAEGLVIRNKWIIVSPEIEKRKDVIFVTAGEADNPLNGQELVYRVIAKDKDVDFVDVGDRVYANISNSQKSVGFTYRGKGYIAFHEENILVVIPKTKGTSDSSIETQKSD